MEHIINAEGRKEGGRGGSRALRRQGRIPGVLYGAGENKLFSCETRELIARLHDESFHSSVVSVKVDGKSHRALLREVQRDPVRRDILHVDFLAVSEDREISANVPLHFINAETSPGVKLQHGVFTTVENQIAVHCLPQHLPEFIEVDVGSLEIGQSVHLSAVPALEGVRFDEITRGNDPALATVISIAEEKEPEPEVTTETPTEGEPPAAS